MSRVNAKGSNYQYVVPSESDSDNHCRSIKQTKLTTNSVSLKCRLTKMDTRCIIYHDQQLLNFR